MLWEIFSWGRLPYTGNSNQEVMKMVDKGYRMEAPDIMPKDVADLMQQCWQIK